MYLVGEVGLSEDYNYQIGSMMFSKVFCFSFKGYI